MSSSYPSEQTHPRSVAIHRLDGAALVAHEVDLGDADGNTILKFTGSGRTIEIRQVKYLNNIVEQDHRFIKRITGPMMGFKAYVAASPLRTFGVPAAIFLSELEAGFARIAGWRRAE